MMDWQSVVVERRVAAILLILCFLVFVPGGLLFTQRAIWKVPAAQSDSHWMWERGWVIAAALINLLGFVLLEDLLRDAGDMIVARLALTVYLTATVLLVVAEGWLLNTHAMIYPQVAIYVVLAFLAQIAFGFSLLQSGIVPGWVGWATILWNLVFLVIMPIVSPGDIYFPVLHHVAPLLIGIALLLAR
jgi:hypothetical protein